MHLRARREAAGLSREQLAVSAGVSSRTVLRAELGQVTPTPATLQVIAASLGCNVADLQDDNGAPPQDAAVKNRREDRRHGPE